MARKSILVKDMESCMVCGRPYPEVHHVFYGTSNHKWSEKYKLLVPLCNEHHRGSDLSPHFNRDFDLQLKQFAQEVFEKEYPELSFREIFGKNYIYERRESHEQSGIERLSRWSVAGKV